MLELLRCAWINDDGQEIADCALYFLLALLIVVAVMAALDPHAHAMFKGAADKLSELGGN